MTKSHLMLKEIYEQPSAIEKTIKTQLLNVKEIAGKIKKIKPSLFMIVARGSSDNAGIYGKYLFEYRNAVPTLLSAPSIFTVYKKHLNLANAVVIAISQSGEGTDIIATVEKASKYAALTIGITNNKNSTLTKVVNESIILAAGEEKALAATKTYTCQLMALMLLSACLDETSYFLEKLYILPKILEEVLKIDKQIESLSERYRYMEHCVIVGRGFNLSTIQESALKLMETCYIVAQPFSVADFYHGPIAMAGSGFPVFMCAPDGLTFSQMKKLAADLKTRDVETIIFSSNQGILKYAAKKIEILNMGTKAQRYKGTKRENSSIVDSLSSIDSKPSTINYQPSTINQPSAFSLQPSAFRNKLDEALSPLVYIVPFQFLAYYLALSKGINPDNPRFLKKITKTF